MALGPADTERVREIRCAIESYAKAYGELECIQRRQEKKPGWKRCPGCGDRNPECIQRRHEEQKEEPLLPVGDQKTGAIGEFYALLYAKHRYEQAKLAENSQPRWDIEAWDIKAERKLIQVKTVSAFSTTRRISPIHPGFHELWVLFLDRSLQPAGFWRICKPDLPMKGTETLKGKKCPRFDPDGTGSRFQDGSGSEFLRRARNEVAVLNLAALDCIALRCASLPRQDERNPDEIIGSDEQGIPR